MADAALVISWGAVIPGRERQSIQVFSDAMQLWQQLKQQGDVQNFEPVILEPHGGPPAGYFILMGDQERLSRVRTSEEFQVMVQRGQLVVEDMSVTAAHIGDAVGRFLARFEQQLEALG